MTTRATGRWTVAILALAAAAVGAAALREPGASEGPRATWIEEQTTTTAGSAHADAAAERQVPPPEEDAHVEPAGDLTSTPAGGTAQRATASPPRSSTPWQPVPHDPGTAGFPVWYSDEAGDAYGLTATAALSQPAFDIVHVEWAPASYVDDQQRAGYATSITVVGAARDDGTYVSYGEFYSDVPGERCQLYHLLAPGITAYANAFCGSIEAGTRRLVGQLEGSRVISRRTATGGTTLIATFDDSALPAFVEAGGRKLWELSAFTCAQAHLLGDCYDIRDHVASRVDYRL